MKTISKRDLMSLIGAYQKTSTMQKNQVVIKFTNGVIFESYGTLIGTRIQDKLYLTNDHDYSTTTSKWCKQWCGLTTAQRQQGLEDGTIIQIV